MTRSRHRSFRLTPPVGMEGKRVKPRLRIFAWVEMVVVLTVLFSAAAAVMFIGLPYSGCGQFSARQEFALEFAFFVTLLISVLLGRVMLLVLAVRVGWISSEEAWARWTDSRSWPEEWLEPIDEENSDRPIEPDLTG